MGTRHSPARRKTGFTLIELLVVVSIIALLISILLPSLKRARMQAQAVACAAHEKQVATAVFTYQLENRGFLPNNLWSEWDWGVEKKDLWFYKLFPTYVGDPRVFICLGDPFRSQFDFEANFPFPNFPKRSNARALSCGYGMNYVFRHWHEPESFHIERYAPSRPRSTILFAEVGPDDHLETGPLGSALFRVGKPWRDGGRIVWDDGDRSWYSGPTWLTARHGGAINMVSLDGAVHRVRTRHMLRTPIESSYDKCAAGDCYFCVKDKPRYGGDQNIPHYSFAHADLYWWTGPYPMYPGT